MRSMTEAQTARSTLPSAYGSWPSSCLRIYVCWLAGCLIGGSHADNARASCCCPAQAIRAPCVRLPVQPKKALAGCDSVRFIALLTHLKTAAGQLQLSCSTYTMSTLSFTVVSAPPLNLVPVDVPGDAAQRRRVRV